MTHPSKNGLKYRLLDFSKKSYHLSKIKLQSCLRSLDGFLKEAKEIGRIYDFTFDKWY